MTPWDELADAYGRLLAAQRAHDAAADDLDRAIAMADVRHAEADVKRLRDHLGQLGGLLFVLALENAPDAMRASLDSLVGYLTRATWDRATRAHQRATRALNDVDAMRQRIRELERAMANRTVGVGEPGR